MRSAEPNGFVADGHERAREGFRTQIEAEYAERLRKATSQQAARLRKEMQRKIKSLVDRKAPPEALY
jgi:hypothetical protein